MIKGDLSLKASQTLKTGNISTIIKPYKFLSFSVWLTRSNIWRNRLKCSKKIKTNLRLACQYRPVTMQSSCNNTNHYWWYIYSLFLKYVYKFLVVSGLYRKGKCNQPAGTRRPSLSISTRLNITSRRHYKKQEPSQKTSQTYFIIYFYT